MKIKVVKDSSIQSQCSLVKTGLILMITPVSGLIRFIVDRLTLEFFGQYTDDRKPVMFCILEFTFKPTMHN